MNSAASGDARTLLDALIQSLTGARRTPEDIASPAALLWTDADGQWQPLIPQLMKVLPQLLCLGAYRPQERTGPVIWLRCVVDGALAGVVPPNTAPVLYLPKVTRQDLRAGGDCPPDLQPLIEL
ncbi:PglZ domain protein, partial [mine drainage metagenome]